MLYGFCFPLLIKYGKRIIHLTLTFFKFTCQLKTPEGMPDSDFEISSSRNFSKIAVECNSYSKISQTRTEVSFFGVYDCFKKSCFPKEVRKCDKLVVECVSGKMI